MKPIVAIALFVLTAYLTAQIEHAPTVAQCQADQRLWLAQVEDRYHRSGLPHYYEMNTRMEEMNACGKVDPANEPRYNSTMYETNAEETLRLMNFIHRNNLWDKFIEEDKAGMR